MRFGQAQNLLGSIVIRSKSDGVFRKFRQAFAKYDEMAEEAPTTEPQSPSNLSGAASNRWVGIRER